MGPKTQESLKPTKCAEAITRWEEKYKKRAAEAKKVNLQFQRPPIEVMDKDLGILQNCEILSLSTNRIEKIAGLNELRNLRLLSLSRNRLTSLKGLDAVKGTLEALYISYNYIQYVKGLEQLTKLNCLFMMYNQLEMPEINKIAKLDSQFKEMSLFGNKACGKLTEPEWKEVMLRKFPTCRYLEGESRFSINPAEVEKFTGGLPVEPHFTESEEKLLEEVKILYGIPSGGEEEKIEQKLEEEEEEEEDEEEEY
ncbi:hypothetical protein O3M35_002334 [Rhynocoris fuscipes]|uniref:Uncharacterized protein n=1 Tax=Rhynocoris fuscipes TaxID=488301 RepID=A0AAW1CMG5_9HEMI